MATVSWSGGVAPMFSIHHCPSPPLCGLHSPLWLPDCHRHLTLPLLFSLLLLQFPLPEHPLSLPPKEVRRMGIPLNNGWANKKRSLWLSLKWLLSLSIRLNPRSKTESVGKRTARKQPMSFKVTHIWVNQPFILRGVICPLEFFRCDIPFSKLKYILSQSEQ